MWPTNPASVEEIPVSVANRARLASLDPEAQDTLCRLATMHCTRIDMLTQGTKFGEQMMGDILVSTVVGGQLAEAKKLSSIIGYDSF